MRFTALLLCLLLSSGCATHYMAKPIFPASGEIEDGSSLIYQTVRDTILSGVIAAHPELSPEEAEAMAVEIYKANSHDIRREYRRAQAIQDGILGLQALIRGIIVVRSGGAV